MKKFVVVMEEYTQHGPGMITVNLYEAEDLSALIHQIEDPPDEEWEDAPGKTPADWLNEINGDGMNFYLIKELLPDGTLSEVLVGPAEEE